MKSLYLLLFINFLIICKVHAQCCPYVISVDVYPANPTTNDNIQIITTTSTPGLGHLISYNYNIQNDTIYLTGCFFNGMPTQPKLYIDTTVIGPLSEGTYTINYTGQITSSTTTCIVEDSNSMTTTFEVTSINNVEGLNGNFIKIFPNPVTNNLKIELTDNHNNFDVELINSIGQKVYEGSFLNNVDINTSEFKKGDYIIIISNKRKKYYKSFVKL